MKTVSKMIALIVLVNGVNSFASTDTEKCQKLIRYVSTVSQDIGAAQGKIEDIEAYEKAKGATDFTRNNKDILTAHVAKAQLRVDEATAAVTPLAANPQVVEAVSTFGKDLGYNQTKYGLATNPYIKKSLQDVLNLTKNYLDESTQAACK